MHAFVRLCACEYVNKVKSRVAKCYRLSVFHCRREIVYSFAWAIRGLCEAKCH